MKHIRQLSGTFGFVSSVLLLCSSAIAEREGLVRPINRGPLNTSTQSLVNYRPSQKGEVTRRRPVVQQDKKIAADLFVLNGIVGEIRWKKDYGLPYNRNNDGRPFHPYPCQIFKVRSTVVVIAKPPLFLPPGTSSSVGTIEGKDFGTAGPPPEDGDSYVCHFSIADLPLDRAINVQLDIDPNFLPPGYTGFDRSVRLTAPWVGGSQPQPPQGQLRRLTGSRSVTLSKQSPNAKVVFEMVYAP